MQCWPRTAGNYILDLLQRRGSTMEHFVSIHFIKLVCRITKLGWFEDAVFRDLVNELTKFLQVRAPQKSPLCSVPFPCPARARLLLLLVSRMLFRWDGGVGLLWGGLLCAAHD